MTFIQPTNQIIKRKMFEICEYGDGYGQYYIIDNYTYNYDIQKPPNSHKIYTIFEELMHDEDSDDELVEKYHNKNDDLYVNKISGYVATTIITVCVTVFFVEFLKL
jgi:hypothetical protein